MRNIEKNNFSMAVCLLDFTSVKNLPLDPKKWSSQNWIDFCTWLVAEISDK